MITSEISRMIGLLITWFNLLQWVVINIFCRSIEKRNSWSAERKQMKRKRQNHFRICMVPGLLPRIKINNLVMWKYMPPRALFQKSFLLQSSAPRGNMEGLNLWDICMPPVRSWTWHMVILHITFPSCQCHRSLIPMGTEAKWLRLVVITP